MNYIPVASAADASMVWGMARNKMIEFLNEHNRYDAPPITEFCEIRNVGLAILEKYSPEKHLFVGIGRSPVAYMTFIEILHPDSVIHLPLSCASNWWPMENCREHELGNLCDHLQRFIPDRALQERTIVAVDMTISGRSLLGGMEAIRSWLKGLKYPNKVEGFAIVASEGTCLRKELKRDSSIYRYGTIGSMTSSAHVSQEYDRWAKYGRYDASYTLFQNGGVDSIKENPDHQYLRRAIEWAMMQETKVASTQEAA